MVSTVRTPRSPFSPPEGDGLAPPPNGDAATGSPRFFFFLLEGGEGGDRGSAAAPAAVIGVPCRAPPKLRRL